MPSVIAPYSRIELLHLPFKVRPLRANTTTALRSPLSKMSQDIPNDYCRNTTSSLVDELSARAQDPVCALPISSRFNHCDTDSKRSPLSALTICSKQPTSILDAPLLIVFILPNKTQNLRYSR